MIRTLERRLVYENDYVRVFDDRVAFPDGHQGTYYHSRWKAPYGVGIVAVAERCALLLRCYRYGDAAYSLEIPFGFGVEGRSPREHAIVELREETGLEAAALEDLICFGGAYRTHVFIARVVDRELANAARQEPTEDIDGYVWMPVEELQAPQLAAQGVYDPMTMAALLAARDTMK
jgi:ADP-ribose pyrophosphatase